MEDSQPSRGASRLLSWLATTKARWLVVLDDLWKPSDLEGLWPPPSPTGRALVTTRRRDVALQGDGRHPIEIGLFTSEESAAYVRARLVDHPHLTNGLTELTHALEHVPTALARAADHLLQRHLSCAEYLERLYSRRRARTRPVTAQDAQLDESLETEAAALALSVEQADLAHPARSKGTSSDIRIVWFDPETGAASRIWTGTSAEKISIDEEWDRRVPPAHDHPPSTISTHDRDGSIHRVDGPGSENRNDFLTLWSRLTKISLASPGRAAVRAHGIHKISSGNNTGYVQFDIAGRSARVHLDYKFTDYRPEHGVITTTHVQIY
ncbi:NB-ARC domain-containing protein [Saccharothrix sp. HUAS TT1]|uniref:NB-ARC domain-containing protein n=1 Tax=Saccharothrix sp. HUAS TT1 TaxID=3231910 RepID=UPI00345C4145